MTPMAALRERTRPHHEALDQHLGWLIAAPTRERYRSLLASLHGFYRPLEAAVAAAMAARELPADLANLRKHDLIRQDLLALGSTEADVHRLPPCPDLPDVSTTARALGALYVLEGATLGGQVIARHLQRQLGLGEESGLAFYHCYGPEVGPHWQAFGAFVDAWVQDDAQQAELCAAAADTFAALHRWL